MTESRGEAAAGVTLGYHPALDGLRGLALVAIIVYHSQVGWAPGAFLSVSTFFTLSGFLITSLLLVEHAGSGGVSLKGFWSRRLRRLMPASTVVIVVIALGTWVWGDTTQLSRLRGDALASLGYIANWWFIKQGDQYGASFASPSPYTHFWTLAIEEQFYLLLPALVAVVMAISRGTRRALGIALGAIVAVSMARAYMLMGRQVSFDRLYWGTDIRIVEFVSGSFLALAWIRRPGPYSDRTRRRIDVVGAGALVAMLVLWGVADSRNAAVYGGGLLAYSLLTLAVILAAMQRGSIVQRVLAWKPLAWMGVVSYGAYLVHFPILTWLTGRTRLDAPVRLLLAAPITFVIAGASARFLERPIRSRQRLAGPRAWLAPPLALAVAAASVVGIAAASDPEIPVDPFAGIPEIFERNLEELDAVVGDSRAPRVSIFGDSTALMTGLGLLEYSIDHPDRIVATRGKAELGCALLADVTRLVQGRPQDTPEGCSTWREDWRAAITAAPVDVAVMQFGPFDVRDHQLEVNGDFLTIGEDPELDDALRASLQERVDLLLEHSGMVVLLASPDIDVGRVDGRSPTDELDESDPERMARFRAILAEVAAATPGVEIVDLAAWIDASGDDADLRPDGVHFTPETTGTVAEWLAPELVALHTARTGSAETTLP
jgi:peptidoglycan/LPS O-acetylase OafA/YrhL